MSDSAMSSILREAERYGKIRVLAISVELIRSIRKVIVALFLAFLGFLAFVASFFSWVTYEAASYSRGEGFIFDAFVALTAIITLSGFALFVWALRERTWLRALHIVDGVTAVTTHSRAMDPVASDPRESEQIAS